MVSEFQPFIIKNEDGTRDLAKKISSLLKLGDVIILSGEIAAGKTFFVKSLAEKLSCEDSVTSPTFSIANFYTALPGKILHIDLYRIKNNEEYNDLGLDEYFEKSISLIEWGDMLTEVLGDWMQIRFDLSENNKSGRGIRIRYRGEVWEKRHNQILGVIEQFT